MAKPTRIPMINPMVNGVGPMPSRTQRGFAPLEHVSMPEDTLRKLDHPEWLENFAKVMQLNTGVEMTPMRAGTINRSLMAASYIRLLRYDIIKITRELDALTLKLREAVEAKRDEPFDNPHHGHHDDEETGR